MFLFGSSNIIQVLTMWFFILIVGSIMYEFVSTTDGHHYTSTIHEGDEIQSLDFGMFQIGATMDRTEANMNSFLTLILFGEREFLIDNLFNPYDPIKFSDTLHHMFPTLDHLVLPQLRDLLIETCKEFNISVREMKWNELIIPYFQQLGRMEPIILSS